MEDGEAFAPIRSPAFCFQQLLDWPRLFSRMRTIFKGSQSRPRGARPFLGGASECLLSPGFAKEVEAPSLVTHFTEMADDKVICASELCFHSTW